MKLVRSRLELAAAAALLCPTTAAQTTTRVSVDSNGAQANATSALPSISADERTIAYSSTASNLVPGDTNATGDVFVYDRQTGQTARVSVDSNGTEANGNSGVPYLSADGRFVVFHSAATNLVPGDTNGVGDVFVHDRLTGQTTRASVDSNGAQGDATSYLAVGGPSISADGRLVAFQSQATNLVPGDTNGVQDIFVHDLQTGQTTRVSVDSNGVQAGNGTCSNPALSGNGRYVAFTSTAVNLVPGDTNSAWDVFVHDLQTGVTTRASVDPNGVEGDGLSFVPAISSDGRYVAFESLATNLVPGDTNAVYDVFVKDRQTGALVRASVDSAGAQGDGDSGAFGLSISADGRYVAFESLATNLAPGDTNAAKDVFVHDLQTGATLLLSVDSNGVQGNAESRGPAISSSGRYLAFQSLADNLVLGDTNALRDVFCRDRGAASAFTPFCPGDGSGAGCPCANSGLPGHGCENSAATGGALLSASGVASLSADTAVLSASGELATALSVVIQGDAAIAPVAFGDGLRCTGGVLKRLYVKTAAGGVATAPEAGDASISASSAAQGDPIPLGATRVYQVYYRDASASFCPDPPGSTFNVSGAIAIAWGG